MIRSPEKYYSNSSLNQAVSVSGALFVIRSPEKYYSNSSLNQAVSVSGALCEEN